MTLDELDAMHIRGLLDQLGTMAREALEEADQYDNADPPRPKMAAYHQGRGAGLFTAQAHMAGLLTPGH